MDELNFDKMIVELCRAEKETRKQLVECMKEVNNRRLWLIRGRKSFQDYCEKDLKYGPKEIREILIEMGAIIPKEKMVSDDPQIQDRIEALSAWRRQKAMAARLPAYRFLTNKTIMDLAEKNPQSTEELKSIFGLGEKKIETFGAEVISALQKKTPQIVFHQETVQASMLN